MPTMVRARVPVERRRRSQRACSFCRTSKKKCDGALPCYNCARRGRGPSCAYSPEQAERGQQPAAAAFGSDDTHMGSPALGVAGSSYPAPDADAPEGDPSTCTQHLHPRMLRNGPAGERVYIGRSAALSFLQFLRATLKQYAGPSAFTESQTRHMMLEESVVGAGPSEFHDELDHQGKASLIMVFLQESSGFLGIFTDEDISDLLGDANQDFAGPPSCSSGAAAAGSAWDHVNRQTCLDLMLAIGARCRSRGDSDRKYSAMHFARAQQAAFQHFLIEPSLDMIVSFILMAFYMFCACRRNTASLYLGIASRGATILGLHTSDLDRTLPADVIDFRVRIWRSLRVLDLQCNAILGRLSSTANVLDQSSSNAARGGGGAADRMLSLTANFELCSTIEVISRTLTRTDYALDELTVENYLKTLQDWSQALPGELRRGIRRESPDGVPDWKHREETVGNVHVACGYYFGVILLTRPFLVATIIPKVQRLHGQLSASRPSSPLPRSGPKADSHKKRVNRQKTHEFSETCVGAAKILIQLCHDAAACDMLPDNMCILQSWIFVAGLVLGFSHLAPQPSDMDQDPKMPFTHSCQLLERLSRLSPQARRYHEILSHFGDAVERYERQRRREHPPSNPSYLVRILKPEEDADERPYMHTPRPSYSDAPAADGQYTVPDGMAEPCPVVSGVDEGHLWPQPTDVLFAPEISDELGWQLPWDEYVSQFTGDVAAAGSCGRVPWDTLGGNLNPG